MENKRSKTDHVTDFAPRGLLLNILFAPRKSLRIMTLLLIENNHYTIMVHLKRLQNCCGENSQVYRKMKKKMITRKGQIIFGLQVHLPRSPLHDIIYLFVSHRFLQRFIR